MGEGPFENLYDRLLAREERLSLVGLGYVGMPIAVAFAKRLDVVGYDLNEAIGWSGLRRLEVVRWVS